MPNHDRVRLQGGLWFGGGRGPPGGATNKPATLEIQRVSLRLLIGVLEEAGSFGSENPRTPQCRASSTSLQPFPRESWKKYCPIKSAWR